MPVYAIQPEVTMKSPFPWLPLLTMVAFGGCLAQGQPANDMFANRITISGTNITVTGNNVDATAEAYEPYHAGVDGWTSVWWSWTAPTNNVATISTAGSSFDTVLAVYTGSSLLSLIEVASNDDDPELEVLTSKVAFNAVAGQTYQIAVDGFYGDWGSITLQLQLGPPPPPPPPPPAPAWTLPDVYAQIVASTNFAGKVVLLNFWATWCGPCIAEIPDLISLQQQYRGDGLAIIGASTDDYPETVLGFMGTTPLNYQVVMSDSATEFAYGGISGIPTTFIISRQNLIMKKFVGSQSRSTFERALIPLLYGNTRLSPQLNGSQLALRWPTSSLSFTLESALPTMPLVWTNWPTLPTIVNGSNLVQVPATNKCRLFRLRMPY
jgi:thiol-disulfide isomerase/thioredoxin